MKKVWIVLLILAAGAVVYSWGYAAGSRDAYLRTKAYENTYSHDNSF